MSWKNVTLSEICKSISDGDHQAPPKSEVGIPFVTISNITNNKFDFSDTMFVPTEYYDGLDAKRKPQVGDILYSVVGSFGIPVLITDEQRFVFQRHIAILRPDKEKVVPEFLYYTMLSRDFYMKADAVALGAAQRTVSLSSLRMMEIALPDYDTQVSIVNVLKPYDELIENNQKQIKLLDEAVQRIYKEWFIDFRFTDYKKNEFINDIPQGWRKGTLGDIATFKRGKTITKANVHKGDVPVVAGGLGPAYYHNEANTKAPVITVSGSGANAGFTRLYNVDVFASDCSFLDSEGSPSIYYIYCFLKANKAQLDALQKGAAQPHVYAKDINSMELIVPTEKIISSFCELTKPYFEKIKCLQRQIELLNQARDRLLPKIMNGEIEV